jgi:hypothetical protein
MPADPTNLVVVAISWAIAALLAIPLWRKPGGVAGKVAWTVLLAAPVVGPVAFAILHDPPAARAGCGGCAGGSCGDGESLTTLGGGARRGSEGEAGDRTSP